MAFTGRLGTSNSKLSDIVLGLDTGATPPPAAPEIAHSPKQITTGDYIKNEGQSLFVRSKIPPAFEDVYPKGFSFVYESDKNDGQVIGVYQKRDRAFPFPYFKPILSVSESPTIESCVHNSKAARSDSDPKYPQKPIVLFGEGTTQGSSMAMVKSIVPQGPYDPVTYPVVVNPDVKFNEAIVISRSSKPSIIPEPVVHFQRNQVDVIEGQVAFFRPQIVALQPEVGLRDQVLVICDVVYQEGSYSLSSCNPRVLPPVPPVVYPVAPISRELLDFLDEGLVIASSSKPEALPSSGGDDVRIRSDRDDEERLRSDHSDQQRVVSEKTDSARIKADRSSDRRQRGSNGEGNRRRPN